MSNPRLPPEILDHIVDLLHDTEDALKNCCLVSKSWIPRTRKHLFADIKFYPEKTLQSWKETFPDPSTSPAHYAKTLNFDYSHLVTAADGEPGGWITGFSGVVHLKMDNNIMLSRTLAAGFIPFHGFSSVIKSLHIYFVHLPSPQCSDLILSFPLLEDLIVRALVVSLYDNGHYGLPTVAQPSTSPAFTGSLELSLRGGMEPIARRLLSSPGGIRFRKLTLNWRHEEDPLLTMELVEKCSYTLESLEIIYTFYCTFIRHLQPCR